MLIRLLLKSAIFVIATLATIFCSNLAEAISKSTNSSIRRNQQIHEQPLTEKSESSDAWVESLLEGMTLREKIGQMMMIDLKKSSFTPNDVDHFNLGKFSNVIFFEKNIVEYDQTRMLIQELQNHAKVNTGIPMLIAVDQEGGDVNRLGLMSKIDIMKYGARTLGSIYAHRPKRASAAINQGTRKIANWMKDLGINMNLAPVLDITSDPTSYIYQRSYSGDPEIVSKITLEYARTLSQYGIASTGKHFPNLSLTKDDSHQVLPVLDRTLSEMWEHELLPFRRLCHALPAIMIGHILVPKIDPKYPASMSSKIIRLLRSDIGFKGIIVSDDLKMRAVTKNFSLREIVLRSIFAGVDILILASDLETQLLAVDTLQQAVSRGYISISRIDDSVRRILRVKSRFAR